MVIKALALSDSLGGVNHNRFHAFSDAFDNYYHYYQDTLARHPTNGIPNNGQI